MTSEAGRHEPMPMDVYVRWRSLGRARALIWLGLIVFMVVGSLAHWSTTTAGSALTLGGLVLGLVSGIVTGVRERRARKEFEKLQGFDLAWQRKR